MKRTSLVSLLLALVMLVNLFCMGTTASAAETFDCTCEQAHMHTKECFGEDYVDPKNYGKDKTATDLYDDRYSDVTLSIIGETHGYIDIVYVLGGGMQANRETVMSAINVFKPLMSLPEEKRPVIRLGLISLEKGQEVILDLNSEEAILHPETYEALIEEKFEYISSLPGGTTNLHSQLLLAQDMLAKETSAKAEDKYLFVIATGRTYWFDDANGNQATIVNKVNVSGKDYFYYGNYLWQSQRGGHTSLYMIPARYNNDWNAYWADVCKWVEADGDNYVFTPNFDPNDISAYKNWYNKNNKDLKALKIAGSRYGLGIVDPAPAAENFVNGVINGVGSGSNPQNALNYERAQYESAQVYKELVAAGYNCFALCSETAYYQNNSPYIADRNYTGTSTMQLGHSFMNYLATLSGQDEAVTLFAFEYDENGVNTWNEVLKEDFFEPIEATISHNLSLGTTVVDYIGYSDDAEEGYDFDFVDSADKLILKVGNVVYTTSKIENTKADVTSTYAFTAPEAETATFTLEYYRGNGTTEEHFVWTIGENVSKFAPVSLQYTVDLVERAALPGDHVADTNQVAILYPIDSEGNEQTPELFPEPKVVYENPALPIDVVIEGVKYLDEELAGGFQFALMQGEEVLQTVTSEENGMFSFGMQFAEAGVYTYQIVEINGGDEDIIYDETVYTVIITVTLENNVLSATVEGADAIVFYNETVVEIPEIDPPLGPPQTGDSITIAIATALISLMGICILPKRKHN